MAVYTNDLRLTELATGEGSGTWGVTTNTSLSLIGEAFSFGTEAITTNADTHTTTIADGASDPGRSLFLKYTGTLDSTCTITIGPNTVSKLWFIENATSGSQSIIIKQGSGATVTIANGQTKAIYSDGAGSGGAMVDAFQDLSVPDLFVDDDLTIGDDLVLSSDSAVITFGADGDTTLTHTDGSGLTLNSTNKIMFNDASQFIQGSSATVLSLGATDEIDLTATAIDVNGTMDVSGALTGTTATFTTADNLAALTVISTDADASVGPLINFQRDSGSPADSDVLGRLQFLGKNDASEDVTYAAIDTIIEDASDGTEDAQFRFRSITAGTVRSRMEFTGTETVFNEASVDLDFRVESDSNTHMLFVDAGNNRVGVGTSSPAAKIHLKDTTGTAVKLLQLETAWNSPSGNKSIDWTDATNTLGRISVDYTAPKASMRFGSLYNSDYQTGDVMTLTADGNVGINTSSPTDFGSGFKTLQVTSDNTTSGGVFRSTNSDSSIITQINSNSTGGSVGTATSHPLVFTTANTERLRIDASGNVGIGQAPSTFTNYRILELLGGTAGAMLNFENSASTRVSSFAYDDSNDLLRIQNFLANPITFETNDTERMRINSAGDWMVSNTVANVASNYSAQEGCGWVDSDHHFEIATTSNRSALEIGKNNANDGAIITFRKQSSPVGSIGTGSGLLTIGKGTGNLVFEDALVAPCSDASAGSSNGVVDLGQSARRFKDLYLSGGAYLGGTGSANKLDDYEEGTWTLSLNTSNADATISSVNTTGYYTKIGNLVTVNIYNAGANITAAGTGTAQINGLPFTVANGNGYYSTVTFGHTNMFTTTIDSYAAINNTFCVVVQAGTVTSAVFATGNPRYMMMSLTYMTSQ